MTSSDRHIFHKLHSIHFDSSFISSLPFKLPLIANLRCGAWYTPPHITTAVSYFKSTDGHTHQWSFSLKRSNLHLIPTLVEGGGGIIVDATRRGKSMPDALSKTVPIWCAVLNQASRRRFGVPQERGEFKTPEGIVSPSEHDQIVQRLEEWIESFLGSDLQVPRLEKALVPVFITPNTEPPSLPIGVIPILLVSASHLTQQDQNDYIYIQGAGDDHENWDRGLTPDIFWQHSSHLLSLPLPQLEAQVDQLVQQGGNKLWFEPKKNVQSQQEMIQPIGETGLYLGARKAGQTFTKEEKDKFGLIVHCSAIPGDKEEEKVIKVGLGEGKKGISRIHIKMPVAIEAAARVLPNEPVLLVCSSGKDLSGALAVAILSKCFDEKKRFDTSEKEVTKDTTRRRMQWLVSAIPSVAPGRAYLLRVNEMLISQKYKEEKMG